MNPKGISVELEKFQRLPPHAADPSERFADDFGQVWGQLYPDLAQDPPDVALSLRAYAPTGAQIEPWVPPGRAS